MNKYLFLLGNTPELSLLELNSLLQEREMQQWGPHLGMTQLEDDQQAKQLMQLLGGVFKIAKVLTPLPSDLDQSYQEMTKQLLELDPKPTYALTGLNELSQDFYPQKLKKMLRAQDVSCRYRQGDQWGASAAILTHEDDVIDLIVVEHQDQLYLAKTVAVQDVDAWVNRDRHKPYTAGKKGMLPPKLARAMVNLGLGHLQSKPQQPVLYDPFCGTGTVLAEALLRGCQVVGSDIDHDSVAGSLENLYWLEDEYQQQFKYQVFQTDVAHANKRDWETKVDLIVTEPYLGRVNPKPQQLKDMFTGLYRMYLGAFKTWTKLLQPGSPVVTIFPFVEGTNHTYDLLDLIDKLAKYRYTLEVGPVEYFRKGADVKRHILIFRYEK